MRRLFVSEGAAYLTAKAVHVTTENDRVVAIFPIPIEYPPAMGLLEAQENANAFIRAQCLYDAAKTSVGCLHRGSGSAQSIQQACKLLSDALEYQDRKPR